MKMQAMQVVRMTENKPLQNLGGVGGGGGQGGAQTKVKVVKCDMRIRNVQNFLFIGNLEFRISFFGWTPCPAKKKKKGISHFHKNEIVS